MRKIFVCLVILLLLLPLALRFACPENQGSLAASPGEPGFADALLGRQAPLVRAWGHLNGLIGNSGSPQVVLGREGHLFFRPALSSLLGQELMLQKDIEALAQALYSLHRQLAAQGTAFVLLIAPDKGQVVPHHLPFHIRPVDQAGSNLNRLLARLAELGVPAPDLVSLLKPDPRTYLGRDTHWSAWGAYLALREGLDNLGIPGLPEHGRRDFNIQVPSPGDLVPLYLPGRPDHQTDAVPALEQTYKASRPIRSLDDLHIKTTGPLEGPRLLVARDSFGRALFPFLANLAAEMVFTRDFSGLPDKARGMDALLLVIAQRDLPDLLDRLGR